MRAISQWVAFEGTRDLFHRFSIVISVEENDRGQKVNTHAAKILQ